MEVIGEAICELTGQEVYTDEQKVFQLNGEARRSSGLHR